MGHLWLNGWGIYDLMAGVGHLSLKWVASCCFVWKNAQNIAGVQGSTLSDHHVTTGFGPFELPTCGLLQSGRDHSPPKACFYLRSPVLDRPSQY